MVIRKRIIYIRPFSGEIKPNDLQIITDELCTDLLDNEIFCEAIFLGIDAGVRQQALHYPDGITMIGAQIAKVTATKNVRFPLNCYIYGKFGWQTHTVTNPDECAGDTTPYILPDFGDNHSPSLGLGILGLTGNAALFGLNEICRPQPNETVVVSAAAGGVGHHVCQLAHLKGCRVIGIVGSEKKAKWLRNKLRVDEAICYKAKTFSDDLNRAIGPSGVDCYFDNVGGEVSAAVVQRMNGGGRIAVCGHMSTANDGEDPKRTFDLNRHFIENQLEMKGFNVWKLSGKRWMASIDENVKLLQDGKLKCFETIVEGFEKAPEALVHVLRGQYKGRVVVKV